MNSSQQTPLDEIEEQCLEELLCLSTKRLKSFIEGTRCPTDTESSEDSDVEHKEGMLLQSLKALTNKVPLLEHISLEEISSDSDIGGQESRKSEFRFPTFNLDLLIAVICTTARRKVSCRT